MEGERLYRSVGFDLLGRFKHQKEETDNPIFPAGYCKAYSHIKMLSFH
jgi:hypothetical protein